MRRGQTGLRLILLVAVPLVAVAGGVLVAVGRTLCQHRQCLCEGAHRADRAGNLGQVRRVLVRDHQEVRAGEPLMTIESRPFKLALDSAEAELDAARSQVETLRGPGVRSWPAWQTPRRADYFKRQCSARKNSRPRE